MQQPGKTPPISFDGADLARISTPHDDALVITATISGVDIERILIDGGSSSDIMFLRCYDAFGLDRRRLRPVNTPWWVSPDERHTPWELPDCL